MSLLVIGLGNPDDTYAATRHNAGFMVLDRVASHFRISFRKPLFRRFLFGQYGSRGSSIYLVKPLTYMNRSGEVVDQVIARSGCGLSQMLVVCDNLDLPVGVARMKNGGSSAGHNGLSSVIQHAGSSEFKRLFVGIGRPRDGKIIEHVLGVPEPIEQDDFNASLDTAATAVIALLDQPIERVMNDLNKRKS